MPRGIQIERVCLGILSLVGVNRVAEFNFYCDPESAHIVFRSSTAKQYTELFLITWETTLEHCLPWSFYDVLSNSESPLSKLLKSIIAKAECMLRKEVEEPFLEVTDHHLTYVQQATSFVMCDVYALLALVHPDAILARKYWDIEIELHGKHTRGMVSIDWFQSNSHEKSNAQVVLKLNTDKLKSMLSEIFK